MNKLITITLLVISSVSFSQNGNSLWKLSTLKKDSKDILKKELPLKHLFDLDLHFLKNKLASSPKRDAKTSSKTIISLPNGEGNLENFMVYENSVMDPELEAKYPEIKSYVAIGIDNPSARAYFSNSPLGFKSMTLYADSTTVFIEPITDDLKTYTAYKKSDTEVSLDLFECSTIDQAENNILKTNKTSTSSRFAADDGKLRTFRLALSCTAEYAAYFGGTKAGALAGMNNTMTRINGVFEKDFGLKLILIANTDAIIYTNATTDPYSDYTSKSNWGKELKLNLNTIIGLTNYEMGHLLGAAAFGGSGDAGCIGCVCSDFNKGAGYTCAAPDLFQGDTFDIDYVAHEMGHQLGANHTFTHATESSSGAQMEPGSGSTIMGYAGVTTKDVQKFSDAYFHAISIQQVTNNIKNKTCAVLVATGNAVPVVNAGLDYNIPKGTPFLLTGDASDSNAEDVLTYSWEQMDLGNATATVPNTTAISGPLFRSYPPTTALTRYFPNMTTILAGSVTTSGLQIPVEVLPGVARALNFRLTVRDNRAGGSASNTDDMVISVDANSGPFMVNTQNTAVSYLAGSTQTINWTVAGTNANAVNCATVDILLSTDGGKTFDINLVSGTPNTGSAQVVIPNIPGTTNRIMVKGTNQIFFDVNNVNFSISGLNTADTITPTASILSASGLTTSSVALSWTAASDNVGVTSYTVYQNGILKTTTSATALTVSGLNASTAYSFYVVAKDAAGNLSVASNTAIVTTLTPADTIAPTTSILSASGITTSSVALTWTASSDNVGVTGYNVYQNGLLKTTTSATALTVSGLTASTAYSFYIVAKDAVGNVSVASNTVNMTTLTPADTNTPTAVTLSASGITTSSTNLSWTAATDNVGVTGYNVYQNGLLKTTTSTTALTVSGLTASTAYNFYIVATDAAGNLSVASNTANVTTLTPADTSSPTTVTLSASGITTSSTNLSWTAASDNVSVTGYNVYQNGILKTTTSATALTVSGLTASTAYNFYIVATDAAGNASVASNTANVTTLTPADITSPTTVTLSASGITTSSTNLSWTAATDNVGVTGYNIYQNGILKTTTTATSLSVSGLAASTAYSFFVIAKDAAGNVSVTSNTTNMTTLTPADTTTPTAVILSASGITTSITNLSWTSANDNIGVVAYNIYQNGVLKTSISSTSLTINGLTASTAYSFYIVATDAAGNLSVASNTVNVTTLTPADTSLPTAVILSASGITTSSTNLSWTAATDNIGVVAYNIYQNGILKTSISSTSLTINGLTASTAYSFYIVATDAAGNLSAASNTTNIITLADTTLDKSTITYCSSSGSNTDKEYINKVKIGSIDNTSGNNKGYGNFISKSTDLAIGTSNTIVITPTWTRSTLSEAYSLWIDLNQDGDFEDAGELIFTKPKTKAKFVSESFAIPTTASIGTTRMRVSMKNNIIPKSCEIFSYGEVEDYTVNISNSNFTARPEINTEETILNVTENISKDTKSSFKLYPNPVKGNLLNISNSENYTDFVIFNLMGQELERNHVENNTVNISSLKEGVYLIEFTNDSSRITKQFIKQ